MKSPAPWRYHIAASGTYISIQYFMTEHTLAISQLTQKKHEKQLNLEKLRLELKEEAHGCDVQIKGKP